MFLYDMVIMVKNNTKVALSPYITHNIIKTN